MEHLPLPQERHMGSLRIPFVAVAQYQSPFRNYPERSGWAFQWRGSLELELTHSSTSRTSRDVVRLAQAWLYFGLLAEFLEDEVDMTLFRKVLDDGRQLLVSDQLESLVCSKTNHLLEYSKNHGTAALERWRDSFHQVLLHARFHTLGLVASCGENVNDLSLTCLGISVLAEYLMKATKSLCIRLNVETPVRQRFRLPHGELSLDSALPIKQHMRQLGWCPYDVELLNGALLESASTLWYLANLSPPRSTMAHESCTPAKCMSLHVEEGQYVQTHVSTNCNCGMIGPDLTALASIINSGNIPLIRVLDDKVQLVDQTAVQHFTTISHVWSDGKGNPSGNTLPLCVLQDLQQLVDGLPHKEDGMHTPFWIDTLCIPREPKELRNDAILRMREPYEKATHVLVIDSYLRSHPASLRSPSELLGRIHVCGWSRRLWTFQEGRTPRIPNRAWFAFQDKTIDLFLELDTPIFLVPTLATHIVDLDLLLSHNQTELITAQGWGMSRDLMNSAPSLRESLRPRTTSKKEDEALCIGSGILRLPKDYMSQILDRPDGDDRMAMIWAKLPKIHAGMAFSKAPRKLGVKGFRWAPATFMGDTALSKTDWEGPNVSWDAPKASLSPAGLTIHRPAWRVLPGNAFNQRARAHSFGQLCRYSGRAPLCDLYGQLYSLTWYGPWHGSLSPSNPGNHWVIILAGLEDLTEAMDVNYRDTDEFTSPDPTEGLLVSYNGSPDEMDRLRNEADALQVSAYHHVTLGRSSRRNCDGWSQMKAYADQLSSDHHEALRELQQDPCAPEDATLIERFVRRQIGDTLSKDKELLDLVQSDNVYHGWGDSRTLAFDDCIEVIVGFVRYGPCSTIQKVDSTFWCID